MKRKKKRERVTHTRNVDKKDKKGKTNLQQNIKKDVSIVKKERGRKPKNETKKEEWKDGKVMSSTTHAQNLFGKGCFISLKI